MLVNGTGMVFQKNTAIVVGYGTKFRHSVLFEHVFYVIKFDRKDGIIHAALVAAFAALYMLTVHIEKRICQLIDFVTEGEVFFKAFFHGVKLNKKPEFKAPASVSVFILNLKSTVFF